MAETNQFLAEMLTFCTIEREPIRIGGTRPLDNLTDEHHEFIRGALEETGTHAGRQYKVVRSTEQVVEGLLYTFFIVFEDDESQQQQQQYKITAWTRPWLQDRSEALRLTFDKHEPDTLAEASH